MDRSFSTTLAVLALAACAIGASGCSSEPDNHVDALEQAAESPQEVAGRTITVEGRITRVLGDCAFELEGRGVLDVTDRLLTVCDPTPAGQPPPEVPAGLAEGDWLQVTGVAGEMTREDYEYKTTLTLPEEFFGERETRAVILVESAKRIEKPTDPDSAMLPKGPVVIPVL